jgi:hypothetical protein
MRDEEMTSLGGKKSLDEQLVPRNVIHIRWFNDACAKLIEKESG